MAFGLHFHLCHGPGMAAMQSIATRMMNFRIERSVQQRLTVFNLSGRMEAKQVRELIELFDDDYRNIVLDLREVRLADRDAVRFLKACEAGGMKLENCPAYIREWMDREEH
jgi:hypothetical protein